MKTAILKIIDFSDETHTYGTATHMAPEIILNETGFLKPNKLSDAYSFGVIIWELLTLKKPFDGYRTIQVIQFHQNKKMLPIEEDWTQSIKDILKRCLSIDANGRPSFSEIVEYLKRILDEFPFDTKEECNTSNNTLENTSIPCPTLFG